MDFTERVLWQGTDRPLKGMGLGIGTGIYLTTAPSRESRVTQAVKRDLVWAGRSVLNALQSCGS